MEPIADNIWLAEGPIVSFYGFPYPTRMVVVRLPDGTLWVWSPVALTPALREAVSALGTPAHLVSPNAIHHLFLSEWKDAWPDAKLWGPQTTIRKRSDLSFEPPLEETPPPAWGGVLALAWFRGSPFLDELFFVHLPSKTAILADASENFSEAFLSAHWSGWKHRLARVWGIVEGKGYAPLEWRLSFFRREAARGAVRTLIALEPERVIMAHGQWQRSGGRAYLERCFAWLL